MIGGYDGGFTVREYGTKRGVDRSAARDRIKKLVEAKVVRKVGYRMVLDVLGRYQKALCYDFVDSGGST